MGPVIVLELQGPVGLGPVTMGNTGTHLGDVVGVETVPDSEGRVRATISLAAGVAVAEDAPA